MFSLMANELDPRYIYYIPRFQTHLDLKENF